MTGGASRRVGDIERGEFVGGSHGWGNRDGERGWSAAAG